METNRRTFIKNGIVLGTGMIAAPSISSVFATPAIQAFSVPSLGYAFDALEPYIDAQTMQIHHDKHHQAYVNKLNEAIDANPALAGKSIEELISSTESWPAQAKSAIRNHGGGHWNHTFFWKLLKTGTQAGGKLNEAILRDFGSMENFTAAFEKASLGQFGSGWAWLISNEGKLSICATPNQDNPLMDIASTKGKPVIGLDVWEHAYYLKYQNRRAEYARAFWKVLNWDEAEKNYLS